MSSESENILFVGLDRAGKTVLSTYLAKGIIDDATLPTISPVYSKLIINKIEKRMVDLPGQSRLRSLWKKAVSLCRFIIFVVDTADKDRFEEAKNELQNIIADENNQRAVLILIFNKMDLSEAQKNLDEAKNLFESIFCCLDFKHNIVKFETSIKDTESMDRIRNFIEYYLNDVSVSLGKFAV